MPLPGPSFDVAAFALLLSVAVGGCARDPLSSEAPAAGEPAQVVFLAIAVAGGHELREETRIDSAAGRYQYRRCENAPIGTSCTDLQLVRSGDVIPYQLQELFAATTTPAFRALKPSYEGPTQVRPPDGGSVQLRVVRNGTQRQVTWTSDAYLPAALVEFHCLLRSVRGDLLLCD